MTFIEVDTEQIRDPEAWAQAVQEATTHWQKSLRQKIEGVDAYVCYLDVDGFKQRVLSDPARLFQDYKTARARMVARFTTPVVAHTSGTRTMSASSLFDRLLWPVTFSDSWFVATRDTSDESLSQICRAGAALFDEMLRIGFVSRGAIGCGQIWWSDDDATFLGPALTSAYLLAERLDVFGIAVDRAIPSGPAVDRATTAPHRVPTRVQVKDEITGEVREAPTSESLRFARVITQAEADNPLFEDLVTQMRDDVDRNFTMARDEYAAGTTRPHILRRYEQTRPVLDEMLSR